jgi:hypothetical protein
MATKHGFETVEDFKANAQKKFSLLETGILDMPSTRLLLINVRILQTIPYLSSLFSLLSSLFSLPSPSCRETIIYEFCFFL